MAIWRLIIAMTIWGTLGLFVLKSGLSSINVAFFRCLIGAVILAPYCWQQRYFSFKSLTLKNTVPIMIGGVFVVLNWILLFESFRYASITLGNVSYYLQPVFLLVLGRFFFHEHIPVVKYAFILLTFIGVILTVDLSLGELNLNNKEFLGVLCALLAGFFYSLATVIAKRSKGIPAPMITFLQLFIGTLILLPLTSLTQIHLTWQLMAYILTLGVVHTILAFVLYYQSVAALPTDQIAVISYVDPIAAIATDVIFFNRTLLPIQIVGIFITLFGSYLVIDSQAMKRILSRGLTMPAWCRRKLRVVFTRV